MKKETNVSPYFYILKDRVKERGIEITEEGFLRSHIWKSYVRMYDDSDLMFVLHEILDNNKIVVEVSSGDKSELFTTFLYKSELFTKLLYKDFNGNELDEKIELTDEMKEIMFKISISMYC